ncbi:hypothetical protein ACXNSR_00375 [Streptomyces sp. NC-S4]
MSVVTAVDLRSGGGVEKVGEGGLEGLPGGEGAGIDDVRADMQPGSGGALVVGGVPTAVGADGFAALLVLGVLDAFVDPGRERGLAGVEY